jgi:signal transduction histidine kinase
VADTIQREHVYWHELRAPIGTLITLLDVASQGFAGEAPPELVDLLQRAKRQADRLAEMVAAAHDMERLRWGALVVRKEPVDLAAAVHVAAAAVETAAKTRGVTVDVRPAPPLPLTGDPLLLGRCLECLLRAAIEASTRGGTVTVEALSREGLAVASAQVGAPVSQEALGAAFTEKSALGIRGGTGLGLHEAKLLVEAMGGSVASEAQRLELRLKAP